MGWKFWRAPEYRYTVILHNPGVDYEKYLASYDAPEPARQFADHIRTRIGENQHLEIRVQLPF